MGSFSKAVFKWIDSIPEKARKAKFRIGENIAIIRKRKLYNQVKWSAEEKSQFDAFWKKWGVRPYWHKLYQSMNGVFDVRYFPEKLYSTKLESLLNPWIYSKVFNDKNMIECIWGDVDDIHIPKRFMSCINGCFFDSNNKCLSKHDYLGVLADVKDCVLKPTVDTSSGIGFRKLNIKNGMDLDSGESIASIINNAGKNFIIQEYIVNSSRIKALCPRSLNTIRITTYRTNSKINYVPLAFRVGIGDSNVDNIHAGGLGIGINTDGTLKDKAYQLGWGDSAKIFYSHPLSGIVFKDYYIGDIQRLIKAAIRLHEKVPQLGIISWDLTFNDKDDVVLIEANCSGQGVWFPQVINGESLFGDDTEFFLKIAKEASSG